MSIVETAKAYGTKVHADANHKYGDQPYTVHLSIVASYARGFGYLLPENLRERAEAAAWVHDAIEDARQTYNDVVQATSVEIAEIAYALTNEKGKTRKERASKRYYDGIRKAGPVAVFTKICDRLANVSYSVHSPHGKRSMKDVYRKEHAAFKHELDVLYNLYTTHEAPADEMWVDFTPMWDELARLLNQ